MTKVGFLSGLELALANVSNEVYQATWDVEQHEYSGNLTGNGHHLRQEMALRAQILLYNAWRDQAEKDELSPSHPVKEALRIES